MAEISIHLCVTVSTLLTTFNSYLVSYYIRINKYMQSICQLMALLMITNKFTKTVTNKRSINTLMACCYLLQTKLSFQDTKVRIYEINFVLHNCNTKHRTVCYK